LQLGSTDKALDLYHKDLELSEALAKAEPANVQAQAGLSYSLYAIAKALERSAGPAQARASHERSLAIDREISKRTPSSASAREQVAFDCELLSELCQRLHDWPAAVNYSRQSLEHAQAARQLAGKAQPFEWDFSETFATLADAQKGAGQMREARQSYEEALKIDAKSIYALSALAWLLATTWDSSVRDGTRAIELAKTACELSGWNDPDSLDTLAAAHAEAGHFDEAVKWEQKALEQAKALRVEQVEEYKSRMELYKSRQPFHEVKPAPRAAATAPVPKSRSATRVNTS
jgi:tetratricopeptide (TPR) repeat protein